MGNERANDIVNRMHCAWFEWYQIPDNSTVLFVDDENIENHVCSSGSWKVVRPDIVKNIQGCFDVILCNTVLEKEENPDRLLAELYQHLNPSGKMLIAMNNRIGIRYFVGDRDPYTNRNFDPIENYWRTYRTPEDKFVGRMYARSEIEDILQKAGIEKGQYKFYSVISDINNASMIISDDYIPNEDLSNRIFPTYNYPPTVFLDEEPLYRTLVNNDLLHKMANAFLIEVKHNERRGSLSDVEQVTTSLDRGKKNAMCTVIHKSGIVEKRAIFSEGRERLKKLESNLRDIKAHGLKVVDGQLENDTFTMPFLNALSGQLVLNRLIRSDVNEFLRLFDHFCELILCSSEHESENDEEVGGPVLCSGYVDLVPLNSFYINDDFVFFDQEYKIEHYPANALISRAIQTFYAGNDEAELFLPMDQLYERYGIRDQKQVLREYEWRFLADIRNDRLLDDYHKKTRRNANVVNANRQRMNLSEDDYERLFVNIFDQTESRDLILFGSGKFAAQFLALYGSDYHIPFVVDNNKEKWGKEIEGYVIKSPAALQEYEHGQFKVLICIKNYISVLNQLRDGGIEEVSIFDPGKAYARKRKPIIQVENTNSKKKYHCGYIAGVFDMFHVGHLNMFRRAKELCDYLIVGVVSDEGVKKFKKTETVIPFAERLEMIKSCRYVDEVTEIPLQFGSTEDAWRMHHFDVQFSGSDYINNKDWLMEKEFLEKHGATMEFFPYTQSTSSSKLKELIARKLID